MWHLKKSNGLKTLIETTQNQISATCYLTKNWRKLENAMREDPFPFSWTLGVRKHWENGQRLHVGWI
jgi:hypothetical protein